ncbi:MAG: SpoIIE family protein phosphatase [Chitinispirillaceae bacterium]|nr:SpoIIE family protein phosphatase [Chitinispirillaceae bacterium]
MTSNNGMLFLVISAVLLLIALLLMLYRRFPMHLIYRSKMGLQDMFDGISDPLAVITGDFRILRANRAYTSLINKSFSETIGGKCFELLRGRTTPCKDCRLKRSLAENSPIVLARTDHPGKNGALSITFTPFILTLDKMESCIIEHIRDITLLERLKHDLERKNRSLAHTMKNLKEAQQNIRDELQLARNLQQGLLPTAAPAIQGLKIDHMYHPVTDVGGDIYDFIRYPSKHLGIFIGDASGHGLSAAFVGTISKMSLYNHGRREIPVAELVSRINDDLISNVHTGHYLTCFWGIFNFDDATFTFCRAGHPMPVQIKKNGTIRELTTPGTFIGILANTSFEQATVTFERGDRFFIFTDGIYEVGNISADGEDRMLGYDGFVSLCASCSNVPFSKVLTAIRNKLGAYTYEDDYTLIAVEATI